MQRDTLSTGPTLTKNYRGIKRTGPGILTLARQIIHTHMMAYVEEEDFDDTDVSEHVNKCVAQLAAWPESMTITYLLRDLDPDDFYQA